MRSTTPSLFEAEMREQVAMAESTLLDAMSSEDSILIDSARDHLDGLISLARRNGLDLTTAAPAEIDLSDQTDIAPAPEGTAI
jgi:hypothetical protein